MGVPLSLSETTGGIRGPAPSLGQHTEEVLSEKVGRAGVDGPWVAAAGRAPLEGITVLDLVLFTPGLCGMLLSDLGANVIEA